MGNIHTQIVELCKSRGINITQMCREAGIPRATLTELKMGRTASLSTKNMNKLAAYFEVPVDRLLNNSDESSEENKKTPTPKGERDIENERILEAIDATDPATREVVLRLLGLQ